MIITRKIKTDDGSVVSLKIPLTKQERFNAYLEEEYEFDRQDITDELERLKEEDTTVFDLPYNKITKAMISDMAVEKRRQMDKYGLDWSSARDEAIRTVIKQKLEIEEQI